MDRLTDFVFEMGGKGSGRRKKDEPLGETDPSSKEVPSGETNPPSQSTEVSPGEMNLPSQSTGESSGETNLPSKGDSSGETNPPSSAPSNMDGKKEEGKSVQKITPASMAEKKRRTSNNFVFPSEREKAKNKDNNP